MAPKIFLIIFPLKSKGHQSHERHLAVLLLCGASYYAVQGGSNI